MVVEQGTVQALPFTIEPLSPKRMQLWSRFASRAATDVDMWIVRTVYYAFYWEVRAQSVVQHISLWHQSLTEQSDARILVQWLNSLAYEQMVLRDTYREVAMQIAECEASYARYYKDIDERLIGVLDGLEVIRQYGVSLCYQWRLPIPLHLVEESTSPPAGTVGEVGERP